MTTRRYGSKAEYERQKAMKHADTCLTCKHSIKNPEDFNQVICRRYPPVDHLTPRGILTRFPTCAKDWTCGEYKLKLLIDTDLVTDIQTN